MTAFLFILWTIGLALQLNGVRVLQMWAYWPHQDSWRFLFQTLFTGFRFDLLIIGFWLVPVVLWLMIKKFFTKKGLKNPGFVRYYLKVVWFFIVVVYFLDMIHFHQAHDHLWWEDVMSRAYLGPEFWSGLEWWTWITIGLITWGLIRVNFMKIESWLKRFQNFSFFSLAIIFLWTAFIARGSLGNDHLRRNNCDFTKPNMTARAFCMNPVYTFTKNR